MSPPNVVSKTVKQVWKMAPATSPIPSHVLSRQLDGKAACVWYSREDRIEACPSAPSQIGTVTAKAISPGDGSTQRLDGGLCPLCGRGPSWFSHIQNSMSFGALKWYKSPLPVFLFCILFSVVATFAITRLFFTSPPPVDKTSDPADVIGDVAYRVASLMSGVPKETWRKSYKSCFHFLSQVFGQMSSSFT
eukprot:GHVQ01015629.1.p1 GENE.GHVQ01015629.1~~GHVQ01015629.1.p1  ORF type:complete len:191 (-),score=19.25 GHVQ01015629.1:520-1092(-)